MTATNAKHGKKAANNSSCQEFRHIMQEIACRISELESKGASAREIHAFVDEQAKFYCGVPSRRQ